MLNILIADDEKEIIRLLKVYLDSSEYNVLEANDGTKALSILNTNPIDIAVLDIMMPGTDGYQLIKKIRERKDRYIPVIIISAKVGLSDRIYGMDIGADDYVTKPFSPSELMARVDAIYRRVTLNKEFAEKSKEKGNVIELGDFTLNLRSRSLTKKGKQIELTQVEFQIIEYFFNHPAVPLERTELLNHVWGSMYCGDEKVVDVNIRRLRMKLEDDPSSPKHLTTIWGVGYKWLI